MAPPVANYLPSKVDDVQEPTCYELESKASVIGWDMAAVTEAAAMPLSQTCVFCETEASIRCKRCGPKVYYCCSCYQDHHKVVNVLHVGEKWVVSKIVYSLASSLLCQ